MSTGNPKASLTSKRGSLKRSLRRKSTGLSLDTENKDGEINVPSAEVVLDNSKTLSYTGGAASSQKDLLNSSKKGKETDAWIQFKNEIVRLAHTLRLKRWRDLPLDCGADVAVERLSGALTNAVYVVSPPKDLPEVLSNTQDSTTSLTSTKRPAKLLLRIYGPQVEHLIDRDNELQILRRLARKHIGPCLLGTFTNGRFEEYFDARTLTAKDLREPETSIQIAKRMRELHDGIELLKDERNAGPFLWQNWDKWVEKCEEIIMWVDEKMLAAKQRPPATGADMWKWHGLVCGVEWPVFRKTVDRYRKWLEGQCDGPEGIKDKLVFAHNDTQYGNLLRIKPSGESPLLLPANEHKQLIVIDFEYASANVPGLEFANHFTEWCYNYHVTSRPYALNEHAYPTSEEQRRFIKAYVQHQSFPQQPLSTKSSSTSLRPGLSQSISNFMLDSRKPPAQVADEERMREELIESEIQRLIQETKIWRPANSAQWVAWGIVQAKVPGMKEALDKARTSLNDGVVEKTAPGTEFESDPLSPEMQQASEDFKDKRPEEAGGEGEDEFDYLGYAMERAMFFWGDMIQIGLVKEDELPEEMRESVKIVKY
ncbi:MAG: hypothetical protein Q9181_000460 [Wetmoreana brouardii]